MMVIFLSRVSYYICSKCIPKNLDAQFNRLIPNAGLHESSDKLKETLWLYYAVGNGLVKLVSLEGTVTTNQ